MARIVTAGYDDTPIAGVSSLAFPRGLLNFEEDWAMMPYNGKEVVMTNLTSPRDKPESIRLAQSSIANIYNGTGIESSVASPTKRGVSVLAQITNIVSVTDDTDADYRVDLPCSAHLVLKVPASEHISSLLVQSLIGRLLSSLFDTGETSLTRLEAILRGSLVPPGV